MKRIYDIIGAGHGISGLLANVLLAAKGFSCLWIDTSCQTGETDALITSAFWERVLVPILRSIDLGMLDSIDAERVGRIQTLVPGMRMDIDAAALPHGPDIEKRYLSLMMQAKTKPSVLLQETARSASGMEEWEKIMATGMSGAGQLNHASYMRFVSALEGLHVVGYDAFKAAMGAYLSASTGAYARSSGVELLSSKGQALGMKCGQQTIKARYYLSEMPLERCDGFVLFSKCRIDPATLPPGMGDLLFVSPMEGMEYPVILLRSKGDTLSLITKVRQSGSLASTTEKASWASNMVLNCLKRVMPFLDDHLVEFESFDVMDGMAIDPLFCYADRPYTPSILSRKRFMRPLDKVYACDRERSFSLDAEGELLWGICMANAILSDLGRKDRY